MTSRTFARCRGLPDGSELLIASDLLFTVRPDGTDLRAFSQLGLGPITDATWSPDRSWIAVRQLATRDPYDWAYVVSVMTRNGTDVTIVAEGDSDQGSDPFIRQYTPPLPSAACSAGVVVPEPGANPGLVQDCETLVRAVGRLVELAGVGGTGLERGYAHRGMVESDRRRRPAPNPRADARMERTDRHTGRIWQAGNARGIVSVRQRDVRCDPTGVGQADDA